MRYWKVWDQIHWIFIAITALAVGITIFLAIRQDGQWQSWCHSQGGHVDTHYSTVPFTATDPKTGRSQNGTSTTSTSYCLSDDGRILGIE